MEAVETGRVFSLNVNSLPKLSKLYSEQYEDLSLIHIYADKANTRLRSRYYKFIRHGKTKNVAVAAVARELACFVWGMMTENISLKAA